MQVVHEVAPLYIIIHKGFLGGGATFHRRQHDLALESKFPEYLVSRRGFRQYYKMETLFRVVQKADN